MPEISEVRVVAKTLKTKIIGKKITRVKVLYPKIIENNIDEFISLIENKTFKKITTFGKWLIFNLGDYSLISHLRMEGKYFYEPSTSEIEKHSHIIFTLDNGYDLRYNDVRKFGKMKILKTEDIFKEKSLINLGKEPDDTSLDEKYLLHKFSNIKKPIKEVLLDQTIINGLGNIYANEVLFASNINPLKPAKDITKEEATKIICNSAKIILKSESLGGCTIRSYTSSLGVIGHYQDELKVHMRENENCYVCKNKIVKIKVNGRSTYYCPKCQK